jgi:hypothetical protein
MNLSTLWWTKYYTSGATLWWALIVDDGRFSWSEIPTPNKRCPNASRTPTDQRVVIIIGKYPLEKIIRTLAVRPVGVEPVRCRALLT